MRVSILSSSRDDIGDIYKEAARQTAKYLADQGVEFNWGSGKFGIMGICYEEFAKKGNKIHGYTSSKYAFEIEDLPKAEHEIFDDTFDLKKNLFNDGDIIVCLPGGTGTISEFFAYLEEIRSNDRNQKLIVCNYYEWFTKADEYIQYLVEHNFNNDSLFNYFTLVNTFDEFVEAFEDVKKQLNE